MTDDRPVISLLRFAFVPRQLEPFLGPPPARIAVNNRAEVIVTFNFIHIMFTGAVGCITGGPLFLLNT